MAITTNVPQIQFTDLGVIVPTDEAILRGVIADFQAAFGSALNLSADDPATLATPQGQLCSSQAAIISEVYATFLYQSTQTDPAYARGRWQDAIARIYFLERNPSEPTVVQVLCTGLADTPIPEGALVSDSSGNLYAATSGGAIGAGGTVTLAFACTLPGPTACPAGAIVRIYQAIPGWDSATNPSDGVIGNDNESRASFEDRRAASVATNSVGALAAVLGAVLAVPNVLDAYVTENNTAAPVTINGFTLAANSLYVAAVGGDPQAVAQAIWSKKAPGCAMNGNTTETVYDSNSGYNPPLPSYQITFETPDELPILFSVNIANNAQVPADAATQIQNAIISAFAGGDGGQRAKIGGTVYASRYYAPVALLGAWAQIILLQVGSTNDADAVLFAGRIAGTALTVQQVISGTLAIGQTLFDATGGIENPTKIVSGSGSSWVVSQSHTVAGASFTGSGSGTNLTVTAASGAPIAAGMYVAGTGVPAGTKISSQTSGTPGGNGVYVTSGATTASSASLTANEAMMATSANENSTGVQIDQVPTISADNILVTLT